MGIVKYKGFVILPAPKQLAGSLEWTLNVLIKKQHDSETLICSFPSADTFKSKEEAELASSKFGMRIIDGEVSEYSVAELY